VVFALLNNPFLKHPAFLALNPAQNPCLISVVSDRPYSIQEPRRRGSCRDPLRDYWGKGSNIYILIRRSEPLAPGPLAGGVVVNRPWVSYLPKGGGVRGLGCRSHRCLERWVDAQASSLHQSGLLSGGLAFVLGLGLLGLFLLQTGCFRA
jgi:hypothetical protein